MISIVICTYERHSMVSRLVRVLLSELRQGDEIVVIDSSKETFSLNHENVKILKSIHSNQLYQRLLGKSLASNNWLLFLDDDMFPMTEGSLDYIKSLNAIYQESKGFALNFVDYYDRNSLSSHKLTNSQKKNISSIRSLLNISSLADGKVGWNGARGVQPINAETEWFSGGAFYVERELFFAKMDYRMLSLFEAKIGMGEDLMLSFGMAAGNGKIIAVEKPLFWHMDNSTSNYATNTYSYERRVMSSRLLLNIYIAKWRGIKLIKAIAVYFYFYIFKVTSTLIFRKPNIVERLYGQSSGFIAGFRVLFWNLEEHKKYWRSEVSKNLNLVRE